jgi:hypothetical protein
MALLAVLPWHSAQADHRHSFYGYGDHYRHSGWSIGYSTGYRYGDWRRDRWNSWDRWDSRYRSHGRYGVYRHDGFNSASFVGGLVLGSVLAAPRYEVVHPVRRTVRTVVVAPRHEVTVIRSAGNVVGRTHDRRLLKDLQGRCFERRVEDGRELRTELDPEECDF